MDGHASARIVWVLDCEGVLTCRVLLGAPDLIRQKCRILRTAGRLRTVFAIHPALILRIITCFA